MLDARIVVMDSGDLLNLGLQWDWPGVSAGAYSNSELHGGQRGSSSGPRWPWGIQVGYTTGKEFTNSLLLTLNLLSENDEATVVASPHVMAQDGKEAQIKVVTEEYFKITEESSYYTRFELETIETGTILTITPRIGDNNEITLEMVTEVSDVIARGEDNLPIVTRRSTKNTVRIEDGGTAAVAGLMDTRKRIQKSKAPGLGDIPILGLFFNNTNKSESTRQVAVFITARLMSGKGKLGQESTGYLTPIQPVGEEFKIVLQKAISVLDKEE
jgi:type II secretory pathway component GspD/PulD (secretin)